MGKKPLLESEGVVLNAVLDELQRDHAVKDIAGWDTGFADLGRALDGIQPGLYLLIGPPAIGKTCFAKQLLDQVAMLNRAAGMFFSFAETKKELRIKTLARLSNLDQREIRRGSAYLLHWYGVPRLGGSDTAELPPSWEKLRCAAEGAKTWLDLIYLVECTRYTTLHEIEAQIAESRSRAGCEQMMIVIDDCQRLGDSAQSLSARLPIVTEQLQETAIKLNVALLAVWPNLEASGTVAPQVWSDRVVSPDVVLVMEKDLERTKKLTEPNQAITLYIVKNRGGEKGKLAFDFYPACAMFAEAH